MTVVTFLDPAMDELQEAAEWYNRRDAGVGMSCWRKRITQSINSCLTPLPGRSLVGMCTVNSSIASRSICFIESEPSASRSLPSLITVANRGTGRGVTEGNIDRGETCSSTAVF